MGAIFQIHKPENYDFINPTPDKISLIAGTPNWGAQMLDDSLCQGIADGGFNVVSTSIGNNPINGSDYIKESLINCQNHNLKLFLHNNGIKDFTREFISTYSPFENLAGWIIDNKPFLTNSNCIDLKSYLTYININNYYEDNLPKDKRLPILLTLTGDWNRDGENNVIDSFPDYIKTFQLLYKPSFWPFVFFPDVTKDSSNAELEHERVLNYFKSLQYFAYISRFTATPFWTYCRCQQFYNVYGYKAPKPTTERIREVVFSSLAYGAQGIYYWNYRQTYGSNYSNGPLDANGNKTETWNIVRQVNREVNAFASVFADCEMIDCRFFTKEEDHKWQKIFKYPMGPLRGIFPSGGDSPELLISHINNKGKDYLVIVSVPFKTGFSSTVTFQLSNYWDITRLYTNVTGYLLSSKVNESLTHTFKEGDYLVLSWE